MWKKEPFVLFYQFQKLPKTMPPILANAIVASFSNLTFPPIKTSLYFHFSWCFFWSHTSFICLVVCYFCGCYCLCYRYAVIVLVPVLIPLTLRGHLIWRNWVLLNLKSHFPFPLAIPCRHLYIGGHVWINPKP